MGTALCSYFWCSRRSLLLFVSTPHLVVKHRYRQISFLGDVKLWAGGNTRKAAIVHIIYVFRFIFLSSCLLLKFAFCFVFAGTSLLCLPSFFLALVRLCT